MFVHKAFFLMFFYSCRTHDKNLLMPPVSVRFRATAATRRLSPEGVTGTADADRRGQAGTTRLRPFCSRLVPTTAVRPVPIGQLSPGPPFHERHPAVSPAAATVSTGLATLGEPGDAGGQRPGRRLQQVRRFGRRLRGQLGHGRPNIVCPARRDGAATASSTRPTTTWRRRSPDPNTTSRNLAFD